jgi:hypothetical protein
VAAVVSRRRSRLGVVVGAGVLAVATAACSSASSPGSQVAQWVSANQFGSTIGTLLADGARVERVIAEHQGTGALKASCGVLESDAGTAGGVLPTPDRQLTSTVQAAVRDELDAAGHCYGVAPTDTAALTTADRDIVRADALLEQAVQEISGLTGRVPSTTTTTTPGGGGGDPFGF